MDIINLYENFNSYFNEDFKAIFEKISKIAYKSNHKLYLIGGLVRDLLLNEKSLDIDITVEGNAIEFAQILKNECNAKILSTHRDFGTVKVEIDGEKIDFASTRSETYPKKGHLPKVGEIGCSLKKDIARRDFTINSLAMSLNQNSFADLIDHVNGYEDLKNKKIRILHDKSFIDDPTRIIRGLKYSTRLGFELDKHTLKLQQEYLNNINYDMGYKRIKQEIKKTFENCADNTFDKFIKQGIFELVNPNFTPHPGSAHPLPQGSRVSELINLYPVKHPWIVYFGVITINENINRFELTKIEREILENSKDLLSKELKNDFEIYKALRPQKIETLLIIAILGKEKEVLHYLNDLRKIKLHIDGKELVKLGYKPSKSFSEGFDYVLKEKLKNPKITKSEELELIKSFLD